jgi:uncharacterized spore protein YtfJ
MEAMETDRKEEQIMIEVDVQKEMQTTMSATAHVMSKMIDVANVDAVFGKPVERGDTTIIPCCEVSMGGGMGMGSGPAGTPEQKNIMVGMGGGAGGGANSRPIAVIVMTPEGVHVKPILDLNKVVLSAFIAGAFMLPWLVRLSRAFRAGKGKELSFGQLKRAIGR